MHWRVAQVKCLCVTKLFPSIGDIFKLWNIIYIYNNYLLMFNLMLIVLLLLCQKSPFVFGTFLKQQIQKERFVSIANVVHYFSQIVSVPRHLRIWKRPTQLRQSVSRWGRCLPCLLLKGHIISIITIMKVILIDNQTSGVLRLNWPPPYCEILPIKISNKIKNNFIIFFFLKIVT